MLQVLTRFPVTWWIRSNITSEVGFPEVLGLTIILYYISIRGFMNSWPINSDPWSYVISIGLGYLDTRVVSSKFMIDIALLSWYFDISNHPVTWYITVTDFWYKFSFCPLLHTTWVPIISTHSLFHGIYSCFLAGNLPYFIFDRFVRWKVSQLVPSFPPVLYDARPVQMLANNFLHSINSWTKDIHMVPMNT